MMRGGACSGSKRPKVVKQERLPQMGLKGVCGQLTRLRRGLGWVGLAGYGSGREDRFQRRGISRVPPGSPGFLPGSPGFCRGSAGFLPGSLFWGVSLFSATSGVRLEKNTFPRIYVFFTLLCKADCMARRAASICGHEDAFVHDLVHFSFNAGEL